MNLTKRWLTFEMAQPFKIQKLLLLLAQKFKNERHKIFFSKNIFFYVDSTKSTTNPFL